MSFSSYLQEQISDYVEEFLLEESKENHHQFIEDFSHDHNSEFYYEDFTEDEEQEFLEFQSKYN